LFRPGNGIQLVDLTEKTEGQIKTSKLQKTKKYYKKNLLCSKSQRNQIQALFR